MAFLGKIRNLNAKKLEKEKITNNAVRAAAIEVRKQKAVKSRYKKVYTQQEWDRFDDAQKQILTARYNVTLSDYTTKGEKRKEFIKNLPKNFDKGMQKFDKGQKQFWSEWDKGFAKAGAKKGTVFGSSSNAKFFNSSKPSKSKSNQSSSTPMFGSRKKYKF